MVRTKRLDDYINKSDYEIILWMQLAGINISNKTILKMVKKGKFE